MGKGDRRRAGRPRKDGERYPSGKLKPQPKAPGADLDTLERVTFAQSPMQTVLFNRARRLALEYDIVLPEMPIPKRAAEKLRLKGRSDVLGKMEVAGKLTPAQAAAARRYAELRAEHREVQGLPPDNAPALDPNRVRGRSVGAEDPFAVYTTRQYNAALRALQARGVKVAWAVKEVAVHDRAAPLHLVIAGCDALVAHGLQ